MRYVRPGRWSEPSLWSRRGQASTWRAAARGYEADGDEENAMRCWNQARMILGLPPRRTR